MNCSKDENLTRLLDSFQRQNQGLKALQEPFPRAAPADIGAF